MGLELVTHPGDVFKNRRVNCRRSMRPVPSGWVTSRPATR